MFIYLYRKYRQRQQRQKLQDSPETTSEKDKKPRCPHQEHSSPDALPKCEICTAEKSAARKYRWKLLLLLLPGFFLSSLDMTIVATALPFIASYFGM